MCRKDRIIYCKIRHLDPSGAVLKETLVSMDREQEKKMLKKRQECYTKMK